MPIVGGPAVAAFPQIASGRTRSALILEIDEATGGDNRGDVQGRAGRALDSAVREFNTVMWRFNRMTQTIALQNNVTDYPLNSDFRSPMKALILDANGDTRDTVDYIEYWQWLTDYPDQIATGSIPINYTARNIHEVGTVTFDPTPVAPFTYPSVLIHYHRRIALTTSDAVLDVPLEVEEAIAQLAIAKMIAKIRGYSSATEAGADKAFVIAQKLRMDVEAEWRDWPEW